MKLKHIAKKNGKNFKTKKDLRSFLLKNNWSKQSIDALFKRGQLFGWTLNREV